MRMRVFPHPYANDTSGASEWESIISVWIWICFCFSASRPHFHYTLSYKRKINIIGKGHLEIGIATYFWLAKLMNPNDNVYNVQYSSRPHSMLILNEVRSLEFRSFAFVSRIFDRYQK